MARKPRLLVALATLVTLLVLSTACQKKVPLGPERQSYAGKWVAADGASIHLWANGTGDYVGSGTKVQGAAAKFEGNTLSIKMMGIGKTFTITSPPTQANGKWTMVLDGVTFTKQ